MMMLTIRQMRYFETLADMLHFGRAARALNITQPALSGQIAQMEQDFGFQLFERRPAGLAITQEGAAVRQRVRRILGEIRDLETLAPRPDGLGGQLRLGLIASVAPYILPSLLRSLGAQQPGLELHLKESVTERLLLDLAAGALDCALIATPVHDPAFRRFDLGSDPFYLAVPLADAQRFALPVRSQALRSERLILLEEGHCMRDQALSVCQIVETRDLGSLGATSLTTLLRMVAGGLGVTLAPSIALATEAQGGGIAFLPFTMPQPTRELSLVYRATSGKAKALEFLATLLSQLLAVQQEEGKEWLQFNGK